MCGIAGLVRLGPSRDVPASGDSLKIRLAEMSRRMARRGPDGEGAWSSDDGSVHLAFRRLAILDPRPIADQPMVSRRTPCVLVFNGEIYNWQELGAELRARGVELQTRCDSEVLLEALVEWGEDVLPRLNGMFALAFWDGRSRSLLLARDRFGMKPLFFASDSEQLRFGSQLDQVADHADADLEGVAAFLGYGYVPSPGTVLRGARQLAPGERLLIQNGVLGAPGPFVASPFSAASDKPIDDADALDELLDQALGRAVARHLVSDVPLGIFLSSGTDSSLLALTAQAQTGSLFACTAVDEDRFADESVEVDRFTTLHGIATHFVDIRPTDAERHWSQMVGAFREPCANVSALARVALAERAKQDATVMLSGDGGDELFYGYSRMWRQESLARWHRLPGWLQLGVRVLGRVSKGRWAEAARTLGYADLGAHYSDFMRFQAKKRQIIQLGPGLAEVVDAGEVYAAADFARDPWGAVRRLEARHHLEYCLQVSDRTTMFHGIECRVPLLDLELLDLAERVGHRLCVENGEGKQPLRRRLRARNPHSSRLPKRGFEVPPFQRWMEGPLRPILSDVLAGPLWPDGIWAPDMRERLLSWSTDPVHGLPHITRFTIAALQGWRQSFSPIP